MILVLSTFTLLQNIGARIGFSNEAEEKYLRKAFIVQCVLRSLFTILQNKPSEIDVSIKKCTTQI